MLHVEIHGVSIQPRMENGSIILDLRKRGIKDLTEIQGLETMMDVQVLLLDDNQLVSLASLPPLSSLKVLSVANNQIKKISGLENLQKLENLDISRNQLHLIENINRLKLLRTINLAYNKIQVIEGLNGLVNLQELNLEGNPILSIKELENLPRLQKISIVPGGKSLEHLGGIMTLSTFDQILDDYNKKDSIEMFVIIMITACLYFFIINMVYWLGKLLTSFSGMGSMLLDIIGPLLPFCLFIFLLFICYHLNFKRPRAGRFLRFLLDKKKADLLNIPRFISPARKETPEDSSRNKSYANEFLDFLKKHAFIPFPCTKEELFTAGIIHTELSKHCNDVTLEYFSGQPHALVSIIKWDMGFIFLLLSCYMSLNFYLSWFAFLPLSFIYLLGYIRIFKSRFFPQSSNVIGRILGKGAVKKIISFSCHHDAIPPRAYSRSIFGRFFMLLNWFSFFLCLFCLLLPLYPLILAFQIPISDLEIYREIIIIEVIIPSVVMVNIVFLVIFYNENSHVVVNHSDTLEPMAVLIGIGHYLKQHPDIIPYGLEIRLVSFGCGTIGALGAYNYVKRHRDEFIALDGKNINIDIVKVDRAREKTTFAPALFISEENNGDYPTKIITTIFEKAGIKTSSLNIGDGNGIEQGIQQCVDIVKNMIISDDY
ncbi:MAG: leucine-rich repeat domain-containing protein [Candidatus Sigynarchaeota archaeon]